MTNTFVKYLYHAYVIITLTFIALCTDGSVHLVGGTTPLNGRVEVCYNNQWGGVCSPSRYQWWQAQATVVCRQLGYPYNAIAYSSGYGYATPTIFLNVDYCDIRADQLLGCYSYINGDTSPSTLGYYNCTGYNDFVVNCTSKTTCHHHNTITCPSLPSTHSRVLLWYMHQWYHTTGGRTLSL